MIIPTLGNGQLYHVHHDRIDMLTRMEKRRAFWMVIVITICVTIATIIWIVYA